MGDVDIALRQVATRHPEDLARLFVPADTPRGAWWISPSSAPADEESVARFRIEAVYQRTAAELLAHSGVLWLVFAPLARDASETTLRLAVQAARERAQSREELEDLASAMHVLATARPRRPSLTARMIDMFKEEGLIERTWLFQHGVEKGIEKGVEKGAAPPPPRRPPLGPSPPPPPRSSPLLERFGVEGTHLRARDRTPWPSPSRSVTSRSSGSRSPPPPWSGSSRAAG